MGTARDAGTRGENNANTASMRLFEGHGAATLASRLAPTAVVVAAAGAVMLPGLAGPLGWVPVLLHESAHGIAAVLTGASSVAISVTGDGGGSSKTQGGAPTLVWAVGYLGAPLLAWAGAAASRRFPGTALTLLALTTGLSTLAWLPARDPIALGLLITAGLLLGLGLGLSDDRAKTMEPMLVLYLCAYGLFDVIADARHATSSLNSDAGQLAAGWGVPELLVHLTWLAVVLWISRRATATQA